MGTRTFVNERVSFSPKRVASRGLDMPLVLVVVALSVFGLIMLYSASYDFSFNEYGSATYMFARQVRWLALGAVMAFVLSLFDYHNWRRIVVVVTQIPILGWLAFVAGWLLVFGAVLRSRGGSPGAVLATAAVPPPAPPPAAA